MEKNNTISFEDFKKNYMSKSDIFLPVLIENFEDTDNRIYKTAFTIGLLNRNHLTEGIKFFDLLNVNLEQRMELNLFVVSASSSLMNIQKPLIVPTIIGYQEWFEDANEGWKGFGWTTEYGEAIPEGYELEFVIDMDKHGHHIKAEFIKKS